MRTPLALVLATLLGSGAAAQTTVTGTSANPRLERGANSFTEGEARARLAEAGYTDARDLKKDADGIWRGTARRDGQAVSVGLDFKGTVSAQ